MTIPAQAHFCWIGTDLPWACVFAILSAAEQGAMRAVILHHTDALAEGPQVRALNQAPLVELRRIDPLELLSEVGARLGLGARLATLYAGLGSPVMRADVLRAAILYRQGGVYLDLDTVTVASLRPLLQAGPFVASEFIVWPRVVRDSRSPTRWAVHLGLDLLRKLLRMIPRGWRMFRRLERFYRRGLNNAVMGAESGAALFSDYLRAMLEVPAHRLGGAYALGPDLLAEVVARTGPGEVCVQHPHVFSPLPPEISEHWFRIGRVGGVEAVLCAQTRVVHWYASVRTRQRVARIDPAYVRRHRSRQLYSMLVCSRISGLAQPA